MSIAKKMCLFIHIALFYSYKFSNMGMQRKCVSFIHIVLFYSYKFSNMSIQGNENCFFCLKLKSLSEVGPKHTTTTPKVCPITLI